MMTHNLRLSAALLMVAAGVAGTQTLGAQERRRAGPPGDGAVKSASSAPYDARFPFAGAWTGTRTMLGQSPDAGDSHPIRMTFRVVDSTKGAYDGETFDDPRQGRGSPHLSTVADRRTIQWEEKNSGPGFFVYSARLVTGDSITGTVKLRDGVIPGPPHGEFTLVRQPPVQRAR